MEQTDNLVLETGAKTPGASVNDSQLKPVRLTKPFKKIALALSGGGFRAASFSVGTMSYLAQIKNSLAPNDKGTLLDNVEFISSASGGSFAGMIYAARVRQGVPFEKIYHELLSFMQGQSLLKDVLEIINDDTKWDHSGKNRNFINAFAKVYDESLFKHDKFELFLPGNEKIKRTLEICINATEFYRGLSFRFQGGSPDYIPRYEAGKCGNGYIFFDTETSTNLEVLGKIKLGDILAASSCFPAGFEPLVYPEDFSYTASGTEPGLNTDALRRAMVVKDYDGKEQVLSASFGLMDGGVDDNQGVYSAMLADKRRRKNQADNGFDLVMVTDVASYFMDPYEPPGAIPETELRSGSVGGILRQWHNAYKTFTNSLKWITAISLILLAGSLALIALAEQGKWTNIGFLLLSPSILLLVIAIFITGYKAGNPFIKKVAGWLGASDDEVVTKIKKALPAINNFSNDAVKLLLKYLKRSPLAVLDRMIKTRMNSMLSLVLDINLKQTRRLIFDILYGSFYGEDVWANRRVFNVIYELSTFNKVSRVATLNSKFHKKRYNPNPGDGWANDCIQLLTDNCREMNSIAENARTMGTTLWYDSADVARMKDIVACGQFTACCKLLEHAMIIARVIAIEKDLPDDKKTILFSADDLTLFNGIKRKLEDDWKLFKTNPYDLYDRI